MDWQAIRTDETLLLICMIGCTIGLPIVQMTTLLKQFVKPFLAHGLIREWAMLLCIFFSFHLLL